MFESIDFYFTTCYIIQGVYKMESKRQTNYAKEGRWPHNNGKLALKKCRETIQQETTILATIIVPLLDLMLHKTCLPSTKEKVGEKLSFTGNEMKKPFV